MRTLGEEVKMSSEGKKKKRVYTVAPNDFLSLSPRPTDCHILKLSQSILSIQTKLRGRSLIITRGVANKW